ncbi:MAG: ANTAR domain-containing protein [Clostridium sp.]
MITSNYKIIIGDNDGDFLETIKYRLSQIGHTVLDTDTSGVGLIRKIRSLNPDIVIAEGNLKGMTGFEIGEILEGEGICPCIVSFKGEPSEYKTNLSRKRIKAYLKKPIDYNEIDYILKYSISEFEMIIKEDKKAKEKKIVDKGKKLLMDKYLLSEEDAYKYIRKKSMDKGITMYKMAQALIEVIKKSNK